MYPVFQDTRNTQHTLLRLHNLNISQKAAFLLQYENYAHCKAHLEN